MVCAVEDSVTDCNSSMQCEVLFVFILLHAFSTDGVHFESQDE